MMTINLAKGFFNVIKGHEVLKVNFNDFEYPSTRYKFLVKEHESNLPDISETYHICLDAGMDESQVIDTLIRLYFPLRFFNVGNYKNIALVIGLIGMRGTGKTAGAVEIVSCDYLLRDKPVWSNVPIEIRVVYKDAEKIFQSIPLEELDMLDITMDYGDGCVFYDEVNMEAAESTRFSSSANLQFSYAVQQIRKRKLSLIWTCQGWNWIDNRLRWQTDFVVACRDASLEKNKRNNLIGDTSIWRIHDLSGTSGKFNYDFELKHRYLTDYLVWIGYVWMRPWWESYNTEQLQGQENYVRSYKVRTEQQRRLEADKLPEPVNNNSLNEDLPEVSDTLSTLVDTYVSIGATKIYCHAVWERIGSNSRSIQVKIGKLFKERNFNRKRDSKGDYYWEKEKI